MESADIWVDQFTERYSDAIFRKLWQLCSRLIIWSFQKLLLWDRNNVKLHIKWICSSAWNILAGLPKLSCPLWQWLRNWWRKRERTNLLRVTSRGICQSSKLLWRDTWQEFGVSFSQLFRCIDLRNDTLIDLLRLTESLMNIEMLVNVYHVR